MSNTNPLPGIGGIIALVILISTMVSRNSCDTDSSLSEHQPASAAASRSLEDLSKDEKRAAFQQLLNDQEKGPQFLTILLSEQHYMYYIKSLNADAETIEVLNELREQHRFKTEPLQIISVSESRGDDAVKFVPAKFKPIRPNIKMKDSLAVH